MEECCAIETRLAVALSLFALPLPNVLIPLII